MAHTSVLVENTCEFINVTPVNPLISKCQIKVCYVSDEPNRNKSVITKEVAREMANSLPGSPIVGYFNETKGDFEEHNRIIEVSNGQIKFKDTTKPYGFVDLAAKVWFQKFVDDSSEEREYLMTEGYIWTGQYPEAQRIIDKGNNHSMELDNGTLNGFWTKDNKGNPQFFIINEAIISKLCILGLDQEPCFEGAQITKPKIEFSYDEDFKNQLFSMMTEIKELIKEEGGAPVFTTFAVEIGDALWQALYGYLEQNFAQKDCNECYPCPSYYIDSIWEEGEQKFAILRSREDGKYFRLDFNYSEEGLTSDGNLVEVEKSYVPVEATSYSVEDIEKFEAEKYAAKKDEEEKASKKDEEEEKCSKCGKPKDECTCEEEKNKEEEDKKKKYSLDEIPEYIELQNNFSALEQENSSLNEKIEALENELNSLREFKAQTEKVEKQAMIDNFYMLSDTDKKDVIDNIDTYSLEEIESKLSVICVRNKVSFTKEEDTTPEKTEQPSTYSLKEEDYVPAWIRSVQSVVKDMNN